MSTSALRAGVRLGMDTMKPETLIRAVAQAKRALVTAERDELTAREAVGEARHAIEAAEVMLRLARTALVEYAESGRDV